jgi:Flp pilus assembly protein TadB
MGDKTEHPIVIDYLEQLDAEADVLPGASQLLLREEVLGRLEEDLPADASDPVIAEKLQTIGTPEQIVGRDLEDIQRQTSGVETDAGKIMLVIAACLGILLIAGSAIPLLLAAVTALPQSVLAVSVPVFILGAVLLCACLYRMDRRQRRNTSALM